MYPKCLKYRVLQSCFQLRRMAWAVVCILLCVLTACGHSDALEQKMSEAVNDPSMRNEQTFNEMTDIILSSPQEYERYLTAEGQVDVKKLEEAVARMGKRKDPGFVWDMSLYGGVLRGPLRLRIMLERSGSMEGYDARTGSGDFKRAVNELIGRFPNGKETGEIFIVNDGVYPYQGSFDTFVQDKDIYATTAGTGNAAYTDFARIFTYSLTDSVPERVTVLITDMIYSPKDTEGVSAQKIFNEEASLAMSLFTTHKDKSIAIVKLNSDFRGKYYPLSRPAGFNYSGQRPYYMIVTGSAAAMQKLRGAEEYASFADFSTLPGYEADYFFNRTPLPISYYSLLPKGKGLTGNYALSGEGAQGGSHVLKDIKPDPSSESFTFRVCVDLSQVPAPDSYIEDPGNYEIASDGTVGIEKIETVTADMTDARNKRYLSRATHLFTLRAGSKNMPEKCEIKLLNRMPDWIGASSAHTDASPSVKDFSVTTFGLEPFMKGIYSAYYGTAKIPVFTSFTIQFQQ